MIAIERLEDWIGQDVLDPQGEKVGKLDEVFLQGEVPVLAEVKGGGLRRKSHLVPLDRATVGRDYVRVDFAAALVGDAPGAPKDAAPDEPILRAVAAHYDVNPGSGTIEGSKPRAARLAEAAAAEARAEALEEEARRRSAEVEQAGRTSEEAEAARLQAERDAEAARRQAEEARGGG